MRKIIIGIGILLILLLLIISIRTATFTQEKAGLSKALSFKIDEDLAFRHLSGALQIETVSYQDSVRFAPEAFHAFHKYIDETYPEIGSQCERKIISDYSLLYKWQGSNPALKPLLLMAHIDVVPAEEENPGEWKHPPFSGKTDEEYIWGRGAMDMKGSLISILEAVNHLIQENFQPERTIYLAFGHDEEIGGRNGAKKIAEFLQDKGIQLECILDEGGVISSGIIPGVSDPVALIGIAEKGYVSLELEVKGKGGHSSMPPPETAVGTLARAIVALEDNPFPANMRYSKEFFKYVGPKMPVFQRAIFANLWLFSPLVKSIFSSSPQMNATIRTTTAPTMLKGSAKENILPRKATAVVNFRILPGETAQSVKEYAEKVIDNPAVNVKMLPFSDDPSPVSEINSPGYKTLKNSIYKVYRNENMGVAPYLVLGATDSRHYAPVCKNIYRFLPYIVKTEDLDLIHGVNERLSKQNYLKMIQFYYQFVKDFCS